jgi:hypothetical protein
MVEISMGMHTPMKKVEFEEVLLRWGRPRLVTLCSGWGRV